MALNKVKNYWDNAQKELSDMLSAAQDYRNNKGDNNLKEFQKKKKYQNERGQYLGALFQGRRYDSSGNQVKTNSRSSGGITGKGGKSVNPTYNTY